MGLRYWNFTSESGENEWQFESRDAEGMATVQVEEKRLFWTTLYIMVRRVLPRVAPCACVQADCWAVAVARACAAGAVEPVRARVAAQAVAGLPHALSGARPRTRHSLLVHPC